MTFAMDVGAQASNCKDFPKGEIAYGDIFLFLC